MRVPGPYEPIGIVAPALHAHRVALIYLCLCLGIVNEGEMPFLRASLVLVGASIALPAGAAAQDSPAPAEIKSDAKSAAAQPAGGEVPSASKAKPAAASKPAAEKKPRIVKLAMAEGLRFDPPRFEAKPGDLIQIELENADTSHQPHNFLIVKPGQVQEVVKIAMEMGEGGPNRGFIPEHPAILASSGKVVDPEGSSKLKFTVPKEPGVYGYVCTVPGHGVIMYGALYVNSPMPALAKDANIPQLTLEKGLAGAGRRPFVQRIFLPNTGPASIAVALPGTLNYCFDAGDCRLRYVWSGPFVDGSRQWKGSGKDMSELGDDPWWVSQSFPLRFGGGKEAENQEVKFLGYVLKDGLPEFHYRVEKQEVYELIRPADSGLELHFRLPNARRKVTFVLDDKAVWKSPQAVQKKGLLEVPADKAKDFSVFLEPMEPKSSAANASPKPVSQISHSNKP